MSQLPSKAEIKKRYNIAEDDFQILTEFPEGAEINKTKSRLVMIGQIFGAQDWMWKSAAGSVIAVIIIYSSVMGHYATLRPVAIASYEKAAEIVLTFTPKPENEENRTIFLSSKAAYVKWPEANQHLDYFDTGTTVAPISGSMPIKLG